MHDFIFFNFNFFSKHFWFPLPVRFLLLKRLKIFTVGKVLQFSADHNLGWPLCKLWDHRFSVPDLVSYPPPPPGRGKCLCVFFLLLSYASREPSGNISLWWPPLSTGKLGKLTPPLPLDNPIPSVGVVWIFSGTTQLVVITTNILAFYKGGQFRWYMKMMY